MRPRGPRRSILLVAHLRPISLSIHLPILISLLLVSSLLIFPPSLAAKHRPSLGCHPGGEKEVEAPVFVGPYKMTFASADPIGAQQFAVKYLGAETTPQPHDGGDGRCALIT